MQQVNSRVALQRHLQREACDAGISTTSPYSRAFINCTKEI